MPKRKPNNAIRYAAIAAVFAAICLCFTVVLAIVQIKGPSAEYDPDAENVRTVTVSGVRGEIYDRNGKLLVGNKTSYSLIYEYGAMPADASEINPELIAIIEAIDGTGNADKRTGDFFPLDGIYPDVRYLSAVSDTSSEEYRYLSRVLEKRKLKPDISASDLADYYINKFKIDKDIYSPEQTMELIKVWYEMDRIGFGKFQPYTFAENVSDELVNSLGERGLLGLVFKTEQTRFYNYPGYASHILGRLGKITAETAEHYSEMGYPMDVYVGVSGCEQAFEAILHGQDGKMVIEYDNGGNIVKKYYETEPISGNDVWLTIDIDLQIAAEDSLAEAAALSESSEGAALTAVDPDSGEVLVSASYPTYDLTRFSDADYYASLLNDTKTPLVNRALSGLYAPGSTYKIGAALAALELGFTDTSDTCDCTGRYHTLGSPKCNAVHGGGVDIYSAIQESCNIFFYDLGAAMGINKITDYTARLGLGKQTGIELTDKAGTVAATDGEITQNDLSASIGQWTHAYTPLQLSVYMGAIVNKGARYEAHILGSERHFYTDEAINEKPPVLAEQVDFSDSTYNILMDGMRRVISNNSEVRTHFTDVPDGVDIGGKTGTAERTGRVDNALFSGFGIRDDKKIAVSCIIEQGEHGYNAALPVGAVIARYFGDSAD